MAMGLLKHVAAASLIVLGGVAAEAANLPPLPEAPPLPPAEFAGNWYIRGDVGIASYSTNRWTQPVTGLSPGDQLLSAGFISKSIQGSALIGAGLGYQLNQWLRADVTAEYRTAVGLRGVFQETTFNPFAPLALLRQNEYPGTLQSSVVMANAYADLGTWYGITPYAGVGVGLARHDLDGFADSGIVQTGTAFNSNNTPNGPLTPVAFSRVADKTWTNLAWALMAGLSYDITSNLKLDLGYRYMNLGDIRSSPIDCICGQTFPGFKIRNLASNELLIGMRWLFGETGPVALAAPAYTPPFVPQPPIVRKY
jgi:opacity protein-like surface antigen